MKAYAHTELTRLLNGNRRFRSGAPQAIGRRSAPRFAVIACADIACNPAEIFDVPSDELLVLQTAAAVVGPAEIAGVCFALEQHDIDLVIVLGHTPCRVLDHCVDMPPAALGPVSSEVGLSARRMAREHAPRAELVEIHTRRMSDRLRDLLGASPVDVVAACLDEQSGLVQVLDEAALEH